MVKGRGHSFRILKSGFGLELTLGEVIDLEDEESKEDATVDGNTHRLALDFDHGGVAARDKLE